MVCVASHHVGSHVSPSQTWGAVICLKESHSQDEKRKRAPCRKNLLLTKPQARLGNPVKQWQHVFYLSRTFGTTVLFN